MIKIKSINFLFYSLILYFISIILYLVNPTSVYISTLTLIITFIFLFKFKNIIPLFIVFIFAILYNIDAYKYFHNNILLTAWMDFQEKYIINKVLLINALFIITLGSTIPRDINQSLTNFNFKKYKNNILFYINLFICIILFILGTRGSNIFESGSYNLDGKSSLNEYALIFYFFILFYSNNSFFQKFIIILFSIVYIFKNILLGGRIEAIQLCLIYFLFNFVLKNKISYKFIFFIVIFGIYVLNIINNIRSNPLEFLYGDHISYFNPFNIFFTTSTNDYLNSNQGDVLQSSARLVGLLQIGILGLKERLLSFLFFIISPLTISKYLPDFVDLSHYKHDEYGSGGGGLISIYFYTWLSYFGPIVIGLFLGNVIKKFYIKTNIYYKIYGFFILISFPRWFSYNPIALIKFCLYSILIFYFYQIIYKKLISI